MIWSIYINKGYWKQVQQVCEGRFGDVNVYHQEIGENFSIAVKRVKFDPSDTRSKTHREAFNLRNNIDYLANLTHNRVVGYLGSCTDYQESFFIDMHGMCAEWFFIFTIAEERPSRSRNYREILSQSNIKRNWVFTWALHHSWKCKGKKYIYWSISWIL